MSFYEGTILIEATPTLTVHANYAANDYVGTSGTPITFANCVAVNGGVGAIISARLIDYAQQSLAMELWIFDASVTPPADSAAWSISDADSKKLITVIPFSTYYASALNSVAPGVPLAPAVFKCAADSSNLYGCLVTRGAPSYADGDLTIRLSILRD